MDPKIVRALAIALLDDEHGICENAYSILARMLVDTRNEDLLALVEATDGRFYLVKSVYYIY